MIERPEGRDAQQGERLVHLRAQDLQGEHRASLAHRRALLEIARRHAKPIIEDAFEMDLRYAGKPVPPLAALDGAGLVIHLFSFSKSTKPMFPFGLFKDVKFLKASKAKDKTPKKMKQKAKKAS